jgi:hypothetical protein
MGLFAPSGDWGPWFGARPLVRQRSLFLGLVWAPVMVFVVVLWMFRKGGKDKQDYGIKWVRSKLADESVISAADGHALSPLDNHHRPSVNEKHKESSVGHRPPGSDYDVSPSTSVERSKREAEVRTRRRPDFGIRDSDQTHCSQGGTAVS